MRVTDICLSHRSAVFFLAGAILFAGMMSYISLPRESSPEVQVPVINVVTTYPGAAPADIENLITEPLERELQGVDDLDDMTSVSRESVSVVTLEFVSGTDIDTAMQKVRDRVDQAEADFPVDADDPLLQEINFAEFPILQINLAGPVGPVVLKQLAEDLQDRIEGLRGVLRVDLIGGLDREVQINVDPRALRSYGLALNDVVEAVRDENVSIPGGDLDLGDLSFAVRVPGEVEDPEAVRDFVVSARGGSPVFIRDLAEVRYGFADRDSYARIGGEPSVALTIQKRQGANIIDVVDAAKLIVDEQQADWPAGVEVSYLGDQSKDIRRMVSDLENNILSGLVLVVLVLMAFLGFRTALLVGLAIPFSMLITFLVIDLSGLTLNMVVLFSLVLAVGMLVDNAVVVIENIYRHREEGVPRIRAASEATREVGIAILVSTLTTVAAFGPLIRWPGVMGDFMVYLPMTVCVALLASLVVAYTLNPTLAATFLRSRSARQQSLREGSLRARITAVEQRVEEVYRGLLVAALDHRGVTLLVGVGAFVVVLLLYGFLGTGVEFIPETDPRQIYVNVEMPAGTRLERTDEVVRRIEAQLNEVPDVRVMAANVGAGSESNEFGLAFGGDANRGRVVLDMLDREERSQSSFTTVEQIRRQFRNFPDGNVTIDYLSDGPPVGDAVAVEITGDDFGELGRIAAEVRNRIVDIEGLVALEDDFDAARPEIVVTVDRTEAHRLGLTTAQIAGALRTALSGNEASTYRKEEDEAEMRVRLAPQFRASIDDLASLTVVTDPAGALVPISSVASLERGTSLTAIRHKDRKAMVTVTAGVTEPRLAEPVRQEVVRRLESLDMPMGYQYSFGGQSDDEREAQEFLGWAFSAALILVLALMVAKFDSVALPLVVMTSVAMSMIGVLVGLMITRLPFGIIMTGLGVISLAGIVVNNAIVLLDYAEQQRALGLPRREVVVRTGLRRLRPVVLTAITTILGLIPLSTGYGFDFKRFVLASGGESSQWWRGMGVAVIFGLALATFLTLVLVPVLYDLWFQWKDRRRNRGGAVPPAEGGDADTRDDDLGDDGQRRRRMSV